MVGAVSPRPKCTVQISAASLTMSVISRRVVIRTHASTMIGPCGLRCTHACAHPDDMAQPTKPLITVRTNTGTVRPHGQKSSRRVVTGAAGQHHACPTVQWVPLAHLNPHMTWGGGALSISSAICTCFHYYSKQAKTAMLGKFCACTVHATVTPTMATPSPHQT